VKIMMSCLALAAVAATSFRIGGIHGVISRGGPLIACAARGNDGGNIENELRAARTAAADAANAEARLRNMIASAEKNAGRAMAAKEAAEERVEDLEAELAACRQLFAEEVSFLENELDDLRVSVKMPVPKVGTDDVVDLQHKVAKLEQECAILRGDLDDTREESEALRTLAAQEEQALLATMGGLTEKLREAEKRAASNAAGTGQAGQLERMAELEGQVEALLVRLAQQETAATELMVMRPKLANLELQLKELKSGKEQR